VVLEFVFNSLVTLLAALAVQFVLDGVGASLA
jgi:hypothetical protein